MPDRRADYTNRELDNVFNSISESLIRIEDQTTKTNGAVAEIKAWREQIKGGAKAAGVLTLVVIVPLMAWALFQVSIIDKKVQEGISQSLAQYNINQ